ncbi:MAG: Rab family GTPase [Chloroflexota bacterium]
MTKPLLRKVVIAGDGNVGKTSLIRRYCEGKFETSRVATIGVDFYTQTVTLPDVKVRLSIWDMAGQEHFAILRPGFYRGSKAAALVYDVTEPTSLENLVHWRREILKVVPEESFLLVGNKIDLERVVSFHIAQRFAEVIKAPHIETSALTGEGVDELFNTLARLANP